MTTTDLRHVPLTFGRSLRGSTTAHFRIVETRHERGMRLPRHQHDRACINFVLEGCYAESTTPGVPGEYGPLVGLFKPAGESHANHFRDAGSRCFLIESRAAEMPGVDLDHARWTRDPGVAAVALRLWYELSVPDDVTELSVDELGHELYARALDSEGEIEPGSSRLRRVVDLLHDAPGHPWTLSVLAREVDLHRSHLARSFRRRYGRTIGEYLREIRVSRVARALALGREPVADLALRAGFSDQSHCIRAFRRVLGTTPGAYRRIVG